MRIRRDIVQLVSLRATASILFCSTVALQASDGAFTEVGSDIGVEFTYSKDLDPMGGGAAFFDFDNDGWLDLYLIGGLSQDGLFHNNRDGTFTDISDQEWLSVTNAAVTMGVTTGDINNDGFRDIFVTTVDDANILFLNNRNGTFTDISKTAGIVDSSWSLSATMGDFNQDGYLDIYSGNYIENLRFVYDNRGIPIGYDHDCFPNSLYVNRGDGTFAEVGVQSSVGDDGCALATTFTDYDGDGDVDLYVANDFGEFIVPNVLYRNDGESNLFPWKFTNVSASSEANIQVYGMGIATGDYDEDGDLDYYVTNLGRNVLLENQGDGTFDDVTDGAGVANTHVDTTESNGRRLLATSWGTAFFDFDNDTYLDLYACNGFVPAFDFNLPSQYDPNKLFRNEGDNTFSDVSEMMGVGDADVGRGFAMGDYDNDGDVDMIVAVIGSVDGSPYRYLIYRNDQSNNHHWLKVELRGVANNYDAYGSRVRVSADGRSWIREVDGGSSHCSQNSSILHFGLGEYTEVDSIEVTWLGGHKQVITDVAIDRLLQVVEDTTLITNVTAPTAPVPQGFRVFPNYPNPFNPETTISFSLPSPGRVTVEVVTLTGQIVRRLALGLLPSGGHSVRWHGDDDEGVAQASGVYLYRVQFLSGNSPVTRTGKMILLR